MKWLILWILFTMFDLVAYYSVPRDYRESRVTYLFPGGGFIALYQHTHNVPINQ